MARTRLILVSLLLCLPAAHADFYLVTPASPGGIQGAIDAAGDGDIIELTDGTYCGRGNRGLDYCGKALMIRSRSGNPEACVIDCEYESRAFIFHSAETSGSILEGVTIERGFHEDCGGGVYCDSAASPRFINCIFRYNSCLYAGAGFGCRNGCYPRFEGCLFTRNWAKDGTHGYGGGLYCGFSSHVNLVDCTFWENRAEVRGGGFSCHFYSSATLNRCTFYRDFAPSGAAMGHRYDAHVSASNCIFACAREGEAIYCELGSTTWLDCCNVYGNEGGDYVSCIEGQGMVDNFSSDPLFCGAYAGDFTLQSNSPCAAENSPTCGRIGAHPAGCEPSSSVPVSPPPQVSWGAVKERFR
jgi:hypothetical protein